MPLRDDHLDRRRLERCAALITQVTAERERLRALLEQTRLLLDQTSPGAMASTRLPWEQDRH
jgi:hypothetical protein